MSLIAAGIGALIGGIAGGQKDSKSSTSSVNLAPESEQEALGRNISTDQLRNLQEMLQMGPGKQDITAGYQSQLSLADMLKNLSQTGGLPSQADLTQGREFASAAFQPQQLELQQAMKDQSIQAQRLAASLGRNPNDPMIQAMLRKQNITQSQQLGAQRNAYGNEIGMQLPGQRLNFAGQLANLQSGLASQALQNRQTLMALGSQVQQQGQNFRLQTAGRTTTEESGGGLKGAITGAMGGASMGMNIGNAFSQMGANNAYTNAMSKPSVTGSMGNFGVQSYANPSPITSAYNTQPANMYLTGVNPNSQATVPGQINLPRFGY